MIDGCRPRVGGTIGFATLHRVRIARGTVLPVLIFLLGMAWAVFMAAR